MDELAQLMGSDAEAWNRGDLDMIVGAHATPALEIMTWAGTEQGLRP